MIPKRIEMPVQVEEILGKLREHGYEAFAVGGCVRDAILGRIPGDWDITTSAHPEEVKQVFGHTIDTGLQHGTVTVMRDHIGYEITTYRIDGEYEDGRHPKEVVFTAELREDLRRRDFTINAMAYSHETGIVDIFGGAEDLAARRIRCVGDAGERFTEDALRILRAVRFSAQLGFSIEKKTWQALCELAPSLVHVSKNPPVRPPGIYLENGGGRTGTVHFKDISGGICGVEKAEKLCNAEFGRESMFEGCASC